MRLVKVMVNGLVVNGIYNMKADIVIYGAGLYTTAEHIVPYFLNKQAF